MWYRGWVEKSPIHAPPPPPQNASHKYFNRVQTSKHVFPLSLSHLSLEAENIRQSACLSRGRGGDPGDPHAHPWQEEVSHYLKNASCGIMVVGREATVQWWLPKRLGRDALNNRDLESHVVYSSDENKSQPAQTNHGLALSGSVAFSRNTGHSWWDLQLRNCLANCVSSHQPL